MVLASTCVKANGFSPQFRYEAQGERPLCALIRRAEKQPMPRSAVMGVHSSMRLSLRGSIHRQMEFAAHQRDGFGEIHPHRRDEVGHEGLLQLCTWDSCQDPSPAMDESK
jgi:hypothetical protein